METNDNSSLTSPNASREGDTAPLTAPRFIDITQPPFNAVGDGVTDDSKACQDAVNAATNGAVWLTPNESAHDAHESSPSDASAPARDAPETD